MKKRDALIAKYGGDLSKPFWDAVNSLQGDDHSSLYTAGTLLQNMEGDILNQLENALIGEDLTTENTGVAYKDDDMSIRRVDNDI